jgi:flagellar motor switch protein FliG
MNRALLLLVALLAAPAPAVDPLTAESRVQFALETALSRVLPPESFLVHVDANVQMRAERRPVESEEVLDEPARAPAPTASPPVPLPGFVSEPDVTEAVEPHRTLSGGRRVFRYQETPVLEALRVHVVLDESVTRETEATVRRLVDAQLAAYRGKVTVQYSRVPMRKIDRSPAETVGTAVAEPESGFRWDEWLVPILAAGLFLWLVAVFLLWRLTAQSRRGAAVSTGRARRTSPRENANLELDKLRPIAPPGVGAAEADRVRLELLRRQFLDRMLRRAEAFRLYYSRLTDEGRGEVCGLMRGPAFEALLESLELSAVGGKIELEPAEQLERLKYHEKQFEDFIAEESWQTSKLFGFLHALTEDQLLSLANRESAVATCLMLRFLKPDVAARILSSLTPARRREVLAEAGRVSATSFETIREIERRLRDSVQATPERMFGARDKDVAFWGEVLSRIDDSKGLLEDIRAARPDLFPSLKRFRVKLEDLRSLPDEVVRRVLDDADNEILALALLTVTKPVVDDVLARLSPRRAEIVRSQMRAFSDVSPDRARAANQQLTTRLREAIG